jgi:hypothetical protein
MQKSTMVLSVPLAELDEILQDVASWPAFLPELEAVRRTGKGRWTFTVRQDGHSHEVDVAVRRSPYGFGMLWTVVCGPAWNGHLHLQVADARRTRVHLELNVDRREAPAPVVEPAAGEQSRTRLALARLSDAVRRQRRVIRVPA